MSPRSVTLGGRTILLNHVTAGPIIDLRHRLLRAGLPRESAHFDGDDLPTTLHYAALCDERVVCCLTLLASTWEQEPAFQLRGMATEGPLQGSGIGRALVRYAMEDAATRRPEMRFAWCNARVSAAGFYQKLGWRIVSEPFVIPTAGPHVRMVIELAATGLRSHL